MKKSPSPSFASAVRLGFPLCAALLVSSCSLMQHNQQPINSLTKNSPPAPHLAQMNFGQQAAFGLCTPPVCPAVTPKTLAPLRPHATLPVRQPPPAASSPSSVEEISLASHSTATESLPPSMRAPESLSKTVTVYFGFGDASLSAAGKVALERAVAAAPDAKQIAISGRTDSTGPASANASLATARARTVHDYLRTTHPKLALVLKLDAQGSCCYVASNDTESGRSLNRRVDVLISSDVEQQQ